ncbi:MAG: hypothetical protein NC405_05315 [Odoribacter sp.]|nr:hypothetical protein [Odoribacter sp.]
MKENSTPIADKSGTMREGGRTLSPRKSTIAFLRQFARAYNPGPNSSLPGYVLN